MKNNLMRLVGDNEKIIYSGKPDKKCYVYEGLFGPQFFVSLVWVIFGIFMYNDPPASWTINETGRLLLLLVLPNFLYVGGALLIVARYVDTSCIITDKAIYVSEGIFIMYYKVITFTEITHVDLHRGIFDNLFGVGDVVCTMNKLSSNILGVSGKGRVVINSFSGYEEIYDAIKKLMSYAYKYPM